MRHLSWWLLLQVCVVAPSAAQTPALPQARLLEALQGNRLPVTMTQGRPAGAGWDWLVREARDARFTLIGEEQGVAESPQLAAALFTALHESGYSRVAIELSPIIAQDVEAAARRSGRAGIEDFLTAPGPSPSTTWLTTYGFSRMSSTRGPQVSEFYGASIVRSSMTAT